jgi:histidine triad (HIT) family protein
LRESIDRRRMIPQGISRFTDPDAAGGATLATAPDDCIFCRIVRGDFGTEFIAESNDAVAFRDLHPQAPTHVLIVPRRHVASLRDLAANDATLAGELLLLANRVAEGENLLDRGFRVIANDGPDAGQTIFHLHLHVLGGRPLGALIGD